ncbi:MAG: threonine ammonia-lyase [Kyrpidia tusciae]|nr:threonine ammonia-lyase [Kyrpidia tusciae]MBE3551497.1 threonine ammonia-lyase [Kyrpidia tusciae]
MLTLSDIQEARHTLGDIARRTPLHLTHTFSRLAGCEVWLKLENLQKTGSFKIRGSYNKISRLPEDAKKHGVIAASAGNHAQGVAYAAARAGIPSTVVMPEGAALSKIKATTDYGARVLLHGADYDAAQTFAQQYREETGAVFIHAFDDPDIVAGQGTVGLEILEQCPDLEAIVVPIGGGGLIAGIALAAKSIKPTIQLYGVEAEGAASMKASLKAGTPVGLYSAHTLADGIAVKKPGRLTLSMVQAYVDDVIVVSDVEIARTMLLLLERYKLLVEGSGAAAPAALLFHKLPLAGKKVAAVVSGGNVDGTVLSRILQYGLAEAGRYVRLQTVIPDRPGALQGLLSVIAELRANVLTVSHRRMGPSIPPGFTEVELELETRDPDHVGHVERSLRKKGYQVVLR